MPIFEFSCRSCNAYQERYLSRSSSPNPSCEDDKCGGETARLISGFAIAFSGDITSKYLDRNKEGGHLKDGSHFVTSLRTPDGKPRTERIETFQQQREWAKREGCYRPDELPTNAEASSDRKLSGAGMSGQWV